MCAARTLFIINKSKKCRLLVSFANRVYYYESNRRLLSCSAVLFFIVKRTTDSLLAKERILSATQVSSALKFCIGAQSLVKSIIMIAAEHATNYGRRLLPKRLCIRYTKCLGYLGSSPNPISGDRPQNRGRLNQARKLTNYHGE